MARTHHRATPAWLRILKGLGMALVVTVAGVAVFALLMQWIRPTEGVVRVVNQVLKLVSVGAGVYVAVGKGCEGGLMKGILEVCCIWRSGLGCMRCCQGKRHR